MNHMEPFTELSAAQRFLIRLEEAAVCSLTDEVAATPKPGLVDRKDSGAHKDMDYRTFETSIQAIRPFIKNMAKIGVAWEKKRSDRVRDTAQELFQAIRPVGVQAENAMFAATGGVNTHKGIIFSMGLAAAAAGFLFHLRFLENQEAKHNPIIFSPLKAEKILFFCQIMCRSSMERDFSSISPDKPKTHGEFLYLKYGCRGIRGEAADGFPALRHFGLPALRAYLERTPEALACLPAGMKKQEWDKSREHKLQNRLSLSILLALMANVDDTNVLFRTDYASLKYVKQCAASVLKLGGGDTPEGINALVLLNKNFIERNISPGGCADLLSMTLFLWRLELIFASLD